jgi:hypothetical protein
VRPPASCSLENTFFELRNNDRSDKSQKVQTGTHTYQEDNGMQSLERAFLGGGSVPLRLNEDAPAVAAMVVVAVADAGGTCEILKC